MTRAKKLMIACLTILLLIQCLVFIILPRAFIKDWVYTPNELAINQFKTISQLYGYGNKSNIIIIQSNPDYETFGWVRAITGSEVYIGSLSDFMANKPDLSEQINGLQNSSRKPDAFSSIIIPSAAYNLTESELKSATQVSDGVYRILLS